MNENFIIILNAISIIFLLMFVSYLSHISEGLNKAVWRWMRGKDSWLGIYRLRLYLWCYILIPTILSIAVIQISQLNLGVPQIKSSMTFIYATILWIAMFFFIKGLHNKIKK